MTMVMPVVTHIALKDVDFDSITRSKDYLAPDLFSDKQDGALVLQEFFSEWIAKVGGNAVIEVDAEYFSCFWNPPADFVTLSVVEQDIGVYISHMLQAGIRKDPSYVIAEAAYAGYGALLAQSLVKMNASGFNTYVTERDLRILAMTVPLFTVIWVVLGLMLMGNKSYDEAIEAFDHVLQYDPDNVTALQYLAVTKTGMEPIKAVQYVERLFAILSKTGVTPDEHMRALYGYALWSAGMGREACIQFELAYGQKNPKMTIGQWISWGFSLPVESLPMAMREPPNY